MGLGVVQGEGQRPILAARGSLDEHRGGTDERGAAVLVTPSEYVALLVEKLLWQDVTQTTEPPMITIDASLITNPEQVRDAVAEGEYIALTGNADINDRALEHVFTAIVRGWVIRPAALPLATPGNRALDNGVLALFPAPPNDRRIV